MARAEIPLWQRILRVLHERSYRAPNSPSLEPSKIIQALDLPAGKESGFYIALKRLKEDSFVDGPRAGRHGAYAIAPLGVARLESLPNPHPWKSEMVVSSPHARYLIQESIRPTATLASPRVDVWGATVLSVDNPTLSPMIREGARVVIKTISGHVLSELERSDPADAATFIADLNRTFAAETRKLEALRNLESVSQTLDFGQQLVNVSTEKRPLRLPFAVQELVGGPDLVSYLTKGSPHAFRGMPCDQWFELATRLTDGLRQVHAAGVFQRFIWPGTIFMREHRGLRQRNAPRPDPVFVDIMEAVFHVPFLPSEATAPADPDPADPDWESFVAPEFKGDRPAPRRTADLFSLGGVLFYAATGKLPRFEAVPAPHVKRLIVQALRGSSCSVNYGVADILSQCLRTEVQHRVDDAHALLSDIRTFQETPRPDVDADAVISTAKTLIKKEKDGVFGSLAALELEDFERRLSYLRSGSVSIRGGHEDLVPKLCSYLSTLGEGDEYWAVTVPRFWHWTNLGVNGRYLSMNAEIVRRGAKVRRVFLLTQNDFSDHDAREVIDAHRNIERDLTGKAKDRLDVRYKLVSDAEREEAVKIGDQYGLWIRGESLVRVRVFYSSGLISRVTISEIRDRTKAAIRAQWLDRYLKGSEPLKDWGGADRGGPNPQA